MKIIRNGAPSQAWDVTFRSGNASVTYTVNTPMGKDNYDLAVKHATTKMKADSIWEDDLATVNAGSDYHYPEVVNCKYAITRTRTQTWKLNGKPAPKKCEGAVPCRT